MAVRSHDTTTRTPSKGVPAQRASASWLRPSIRDEGIARRGVEVSLSILFIVQLITAAIGNSFVQSFIDGDAGESAVTTGALLMMFSGLVIVVIGVLLYQVLRHVNKRLAVWVVLLRGIEFVVAVIFGLYLLTNLQVVSNHLLWVYILAGAAGLILSFLLLTSKLVPRPIAALGLIGYFLLLLGVPLDFAGVIDMNEGLAQGLVVPGGLFELLVMPIWLIARGFNSPSASRRRQFDG